MAAVEQEIIDKFQLLDKDAQQRVLAQLSDQLAARFDYADWFRRVDSLQADIRAIQGGTQIDVVGLLREIREDGA